MKAHRGTLIHEIHDDSQDPTEQITQRRRIAQWNHRLDRFRRARRSIGVWKCLSALRAINMARWRGRRLQALPALHAKHRIADHLRPAFGASYHSRLAFTLSKISSDSSARQLSVNCAD